jgi:hypothetical protein
MRWQLKKFATIELLVHPKPERAGPDEETTRTGDTERSPNVSTGTIR